MSTHSLTTTNVHYHVKAALISIQMQQEVCLNSVQQEVCLNSVQQEVCLNSVCVTQEVRQ